MKTQTTDEKICRLCNFYNPNTKDGLCEYCQKAIKEGRLSALADVEKKIEKCVEPDTGLIFIGDLKQEIAKIHSQKQAKQLQEGKFDIISQTAFELKCSPDNDPNANKGEGK